MKSAEEYFSNVPPIALMAANILPVAGVLFLGWGAFCIVLFFWAENLAVGFPTILKIACVKVPQPVAHLGKLFALPFFVVRYGGFMAGYGFFILSILRKTDVQLIEGRKWPCLLVFL